jgi:hypothetical protein
MIYIDDLQIDQLQIDDSQIDNSQIDGLRADDSNDSQECSYYIAHMICRSLIKCCRVVSIIHL